MQHCGAKVHRRPFMGKHTRLALSPLAVKTCKTAMRRKRHFEGNKCELFTSILPSHSSPDPSQQPRQRSQSLSGKYLGSARERELKAKVTLHQCPRGAEAMAGTQGLAQFSASQKQMKQCTRKTTTKETTGLHRELEQ